MLRHDVPRLSPFDSFDRLQRLCNPELNPVLFWSSEYIDVWMDQWMNGLTDFCQTPTTSKRDSVRQEKWVLDYCRTHQCFSQCGKPGRVYVKPNQVVLVHKEQLKIKSQIQK